jgi:adenine-specific DNA-methyltransferase
LKKIPNSILDLCEWGKDDYSLNVANLPMAKPKPTQSTPTPTPKKPKAPLGQGSLFAEDEG